MKLRIGPPEDCVLRAVGGPQFWEDAPSVDFLNGCAGMKKMIVVDCFLCSMWRSINK